MSNRHKLNLLYLFFFRPDLIPPGDAEGQRKKYIYILGGILVAAIIDTITFLSDYNEYYRYWLCEDTGHPIAGNYMVEFTTLLKECYLGIPYFVVVILAIACIPDNYRYFFRGSKSIYLMKRLPDRGDLRKRCLALPVLALIVTAAVFLIMVLGFAAYYYVRTPASCLP